MTKHVLATAFYRQGVEALEHADDRTAAEMFRKCLRLVPENMMFAPLAAKYSEKYDL